MATAVGLAGGQPVWARGVVLCTLGLGILYAPAVPQMPRLVWWLLAGAGVASLLPLLPLPLEQGSWREQAESIGINTGQLYSPQPLLTLESWLMGASFIAGCIWLIGCAHTAASRTSAIRLLCWLMLPLAALTWIGNLLGWINPWAPVAESFSLFPNRNQTSLAFALTACAGWALVLTGLERSRRTDLALGAATLLMGLAAVVSLPSRAAIVLLAAGLTLQGVLAARSRKRGMLKIVLPLLLLLAALAIHLGRESIQRVREAFSGAGSTDTRFLIWEDASRLIGDHWLAGTGAGNFRDVFAQYRDASSSYMAVIHPESDWIWWAGELGLPATLLLLGAVLAFVFARRTRSARSPAAWGAGIAGLLVLVHSVVDVPLHRPGTLFLAAFLLGIWSLPRESLRPRSGAAWGVRAAGLAVLLFGISQVPAATVKPELSPATALAAALPEDPATTSPQAIAVAQRWRPLAWEGHFAEGVHLLATSRDPQEILAARAAFRRMRHLEPNSSRPAFEEGMAWLPVSPAYTLSAWRVAAARETVHPIELFQEMLHHSRHSPSLLAGLDAISRHNPHHRAHFLLQASAEAAIRSARWELTQPTPALAGVDAQTNERILLRLIALGETNLALTVCAKDAIPDDQQWLPRAHALAAAGEFKAASSLISANAQVEEPSLVDSDATTVALQKRFLTNPNDLVAGLELILRYRADKDPGNVLIVIKALQSRQGPLPGFLHAWKAQALEQTGRHEEAWRAWEMHREALRQ